MPKGRGRLVFGVGINDANYLVTETDVKNGKQVMIWRCPFHRTWTNMLERCYCSKKHARNPTYLGCSVTDEWKLFSNFKAWMETQDWQGKQLDKDLLIKGNKIYSQNTCLFITKQINTFLNSREACRGDLPIGVTLSRRGDKYQAQCSNPFTHKVEVLGTFASATDAHEAWRVRKHELALQYAMIETDPRVVDALSKRYLKGNLL